MTLLNVLNRAVEQRVHNFQVQYPQPNQAFLAAQAARGENPRDLSLRDAEHYLFMRQMPQTNPNLAPVGGMNLLALLPLLYSIAKVGQQNYGLMPPGPHMDYRQSTPPDLLELLWGLKGAGGARLGMQ